MLKILNEWISIMIVFTLVALIVTIAINHEQTLANQKLQPSASELYFKTYTNNTYEK